MQGFALPPSSPGRRFLRLMPFFPSFSRSGFAGEPSRTSSLLSALRPAVSPLHLPLEVGLSCRHGVSRNSDDTGNGGFFMSTTSPAIYVGTYHKYNCGSLFGKWFDLTDFDDKSDFMEACHALHANESDPELMFQDWEGIPDKFASESSVDWAFIEAYKRAVDDGKDEAFVAWVEFTGECDYDAFEDAWCGEAASEEDYAYDYVQEHGLLNEVPESLRGYFDYDAYGRDMFMNGLVFLEGHVFQN